MTSANIVIIGGGVLGANLAYQLALRGTQNVLVSYHP
jgi:glycine/D-amino acid oxidase-like deaminating enzyme